MFLPIKGPGGRYLTPREKVALLILGITLVLCVLTILHGESAYSPDGSQNPIFAVVSLLCRKFGAGIVALYALVLIWSGLIYFKGEKIARVTPLSGRLFAALAVTVGISGALGIAHLETAGGLGNAVGGALKRTLGGGVGFPMLLGLMLLGLHLAGQGAWHAMREPMPVAAGRPGMSSMSLDPASRRVSGIAFVDDGDPSSDERTLAVTQAMEEIERSPGVTIIEVDERPRPSIGEEVADAPPPPAASEEAEVQEGLAAVEDALELADPPPAREDVWAVETEVQEEPVEAAETDEPEEYETLEHGLVPVPPQESPAVAWQTTTPPAEEEGVRAGEEEVAEESTAPAEEQEAQADGFAAEGDPYATGGLVRRVQEEAPPASDEPSDDEKPFTTFDWRGRPLS